MLADALLAAVLAGVAVFLLVGAVELEQVLVASLKWSASLASSSAMVPRSCRLFSLITSTAERFGRASGGDDPVSMN